MRPLFFKLTLWNDPQKGAKRPAERVGRVPWSEPFASYGGLGGHGFESRVADLQSARRVEGFGGGSQGV